ncbi:MAG: hypothetical protein ABIQ40_02760 [Bacteroidia bacterium]
MEKEYRILTECYIDYMIMQAILGFSPNDQHAGINDIGIKLEKNYKGRKAVVLIDDDKIKAKFLNDYILQKESRQLRIKLLRHKKDLHFAIQISKASESWILEACKMAGVDITKYRLPNTAPKLAGITKSTHAFQDTRLQQVLNTLSQKKSKHFEWIRSCVNEILVEKKSTSSSKRKKIK